MNETTNIKQDLMTLIGQVNNSNLLELAYQILSDSSNQGNLTNSLSDSEKEELNTSINESYKQENLVQLKDAKRSLSRWLKK